MKHIYLLYTTLAAAVILFGISSCIKSEAPNAEADIVEITLPKGVVGTNPMIAKITNNDVTIFTVKSILNITQLAPIISITPGATIVPASDTAQDFSNEVIYTVTSEDGQSVKEYKVRVADLNIPSKMDFEFWKNDGNYQYPYEMVGVGENKQEMPIWSSGNAGFSIVNSGAADEFPTFRTDDGYSGNGAKLVTRKTGKAGDKVGMPLAAGNLFIGSFNSIKAMGDPMGATLFGLPFNKKPLSMKGYYKYKSGEIYQVLDDNKKVIYVPERDNDDSCSIYAVFYEKGEEGFLNGATVLSDPRLIYKAELKTKQVDNYTLFDIPFETVAGSPVFDQQKLANFEYYLAIVFAASKGGAKFSGAIGSTLFIDSVELTCESDEVPVP